MQYSDKRGSVFNIQKYSIHDGEGIRTLIFMKGCPLHCMWCSNPESHNFSPEVMFIKNNCIGCGKCVDVCPQKATDLKTYEIDRTICKVCGCCDTICYNNAKKLVGKKYSVEDLIEIIERDRIFYRKSRGGVTIGGGEPLAQPDFVLALLKECKRLNIHTAIETSGYGEWELVEEIFKNTDQVLFDLKHMDDVEHVALTGVSNRKILDNAKSVARMNKKILFRIPLVPGCNDDMENIVWLGKFVKSLMTALNDIRVEILPYHNLGVNKYEALGRAYDLEALKLPDYDEKERFNDMLRTIGCNVVE